MPHVKSYIDLVKIRCPVYSAVVATGRSIRKCRGTQGQVGKIRADCMLSTRLKLIKRQCFMNFIGAVVFYTTTPKIAKIISKRKNFKN